ncbi:unnamed protein product [Aphanomyces euteiches]|uniref:RING-type E3 ubiquitin transferase n=1 Tax=Aphanomyces euteiches TaxID=100861 RepID=A0A6G0WGT9_9STRA|nr:hypothetical protein Ae201684_015383 [Aphanomyces euteiches]KAH9097653.1 hypothetical protein Ae201684P_001129 [Aphanomyces euteiches]KAH9155300.1 hypothetical protein AeRB84_002722 [Aphanomyces euteiches]
MSTTPTTETGRSRTRRKKQSASSNAAPSPAQAQSAPESSSLRPTADEFTPQQHTQEKKPRRQHNNQRVRGRSTNEPSASTDTATEKKSSPNRTRGPNRRGGKPASQPPKVDNLENDLDDETKASAELCLVCAEPFKFHAIGECNHAGICSTCSMRMRMLMKDLNCPICKQPNARVIVTDTVAPYASFGIWGDTGGPGVILDDRSEMFFSQCPAHYETLVARREYICRRCPKAKRVKYRLLEDLQLHMENAHATYFCDLCVQHQHFFIAEHRLYSMKELMAHQTSIVSATTAREQHPLCEFCHIRYYSDVELHVHLERDHFKCHLCPENQHRYYRNYKSLESHFRREHFFCEEPSCIAKGFVVFGNDIDYQAHMFTLHGTHDNRLRVAFTVRRTTEEEAPHFMSSGDDTWEFVGPPPTRARQEEEFPALPATTPVPMPTPPRPAPTVARPQPTIRPAAAPAPSVPRAMLSRNAQLAAAFGKGPKTEEALEKELRPQYSQELKDWGRQKFRTLVAVEKKIEDMMNDRSCFSAHLKAMPREQRRMIHELAVFYGLKSESRDQEPQRFVSLYKQQNSALPLESLSKTLLEESQGPKRQTRRARVYVDRNVQLPVGRGWEKVPEVQTTPQVMDAWSDEEEEAIEDVNAYVKPQGSSTRLEFLRRTDGATMDGA